MEPLPDDFDEFFKLESGKQETSKVPSLRREKRPHKYIRSHSTSGLLWVWSVGGCNDEMMVT